MSGDAAVVVAQRVLMLKPALMQTPVLEVAEDTEVLEILEVMEYQAE